MLDKTLSNLSLKTNASASTVATKTTISSNNNNSSKAEVHLKKYFEPNFKSDYSNRRDPTEEEIQEAFKFYN